MIIIKNGIISVNGMIVGTLNEYKKSLEERN